MSKAPEPDFKLLFERLPGLYLVLDPELRVVAASDAYLEATLTKREEIVGRHLFDVFPEAEHPSADAISNTRASMNRVLSERVTDAMVLQRHDVRAPDGSWQVRYWSPVNSPLLDADGSVAYIVHRVENVTEYVLAAQQGSEQARLTETLRERTQQVEADLYQRSREVADASRQLKEANEELARLYARTRELDDLKSQLFANVSHELRTPLTLILGPLRALRAADNLTADQRAALATAERNARVLLHTVNELLDLSRVDAGATRVEYAAVDLAWLVRWIASHFETIAQERGLTFAVDTPAAFTAEVDPEKLQRVLFNLLANAFKFTPEQGSVRVAAETDDALARLIVEDSGPGIPEEMRGAVFERFRQVDASSTRRHGGTGLGLAIVAEFVRLHAGAIAVESSPEGGARFVVALPLTAPDGAEVRRAAEVADEEAARVALAELERGEGPGSAEAGAAGTVLVVEDNPEMNEFLIEALRGRYRVTSVADGREGLERALALRPDLVVTDMMMPEMSGEELVRELRRTVGPEEVPVLLLTAKADEQTRVRLLSEGAQDYLLKPFATEELLARVDGLVERKRAAEARLRASRELLAEVSEAIGDAIFVRDAEGRYRLANRAAAVRLGRVSGNEVLGRDDEELLGAVSGAAVRERDRAVLAERAPRTFEEVAGERIFLTTLAPHLDGDGRAVGVLGIARDVTELKRTEAELRELHAKLEARVRERTAELAQAHGRLRELSRGLVELQEKERRMVARELHDEAGQVLTALKLHLRLLENASPEGTIRERVAMLQGLTAEAMERIHEVGQRLRPAVLERLGLSAALGSIVASAGEAGLETEFDATGLDEASLPVEVETTVFRVVQQAVSNVLRHADAQRTSVRVARDDGRVVAVVEDDGRGFDVKAALDSGRMGVVGMRERAELVGGRLEIESAPEAGTTVRLELPLLS